MPENLKNMADWAQATLSNSKRLARERGTYLRLCRRAAGLTIREAGKRSGIPAGTLASWEAGSRQAPTNRMVTYQRFLWQEAQDLFKSMSVSIDEQIAISKRQREIDKELGVTHISVTHVSKSEVGQGSLK